MSRRRAGHESRLLAVDITSMVDVVFLLIIFFMTTAKVAQESRERLDLPKERGEQRDEAEEAGLIVNLRADGTIVVGTRTATLDALASIVAAEIERRHGGDAKSMRLTLRADRACPTGELNRVIEALRDLGVAGARVATAVPPGGGA